MTAGPVWWALAVGGPLDPDDFDQREAARTRLRQELLLAAIVPEPYLWVWDETDRAQVVLKTFPDEASAEAYAAAIRSRGIETRVRMEMTEGENKENP